jgi:hypothetical protein
MARDPEIDNPIVPEGPSAEGGKPDQQDIRLDTKHASQQPGSDTDDYGDVEGVDSAYWIGCLQDAERAEHNWRSRARDIVQIYRNEGAVGKRSKPGDGPVYFNVLFANTEVMLPAIYSKPPQPVVRSRFTKVTQPMVPPPGLLPPGMPPPPGAPLPPPGAPGVPPDAAPPPGLPGLASAPMPPPGAGPGAPAPPPGAGAVGPVPGGPPPPIPPGAPAGLPLGDVGPVPPGPITDEGPPPLAPPPGGLPGMPPPPMPGMPQAAPGRPPQEAIETAASIMEKALEIVVEDEHSNESIKLAIKDVLLPGRGVCRVRWKPQMEKRPVMAGDGVTELPPPPQMGDNGGPPMEDVKVWEQVGDEYVFWEDLLVDPVRQAADTEWIAFRHLFTEKQLDAEFGGSPQYEDLKGRGKLSEIIKWTEESAGKSPVGGGSPMKSADKLGDHIKKAMVWEIWSRRTREIIWFIREVSGIVLRVDPDSLQLQGFFCIPIPMLAVRTSDTRIPRPFYDLYSKLAADLDETSQRISDLTAMIKVRGGYNSASKEIAGILRADNGKMLPVEGVDMLTGGLQNHIWIVPIQEWITALDKLYLAREQQKQAIYEIMGISDIMRGATKASETATAQRIKGTMGVNRLDDAKQQSDNFVRDLLRLKAEIIGQNFSPETLEAMTGEAVTPEVLDILRSDFQRTCSIDIEADSTVAVDEQVEQQSMSMIMQSVSAVMTGAMAMLQTGILPPPMVLQLSLELLKMFLHPVRYSRGVVELIDQFQEQLTAQIGMMAMMPPGAAPPMGAPPGGAPMPPSPSGPPKKGPPGGGGNGRPPGSNPDIPPLRPSNGGAPPSF